MQVTSIIDPYAIHYDSFAGDVYTLDTAGITLSAGTLTAFNALIAPSATAQYLLKGDSAGDSITLANTIAAQETILRLYTADGDRSDVVGIQIHSLGTTTARTNNERLDIRSTVADPWNFMIASLAEGTGDVRPLNIYTGANTSQLVLNVDGSISMAGAVTIGGDLTVDTTTLVVDAANHRVGIGTATPQELLHVLGDNPVLEIEDSVATTKNAKLQITTAGGIWGIGQASTLGAIGELVFINTIGEASMTMGSAGNVAIAKSLTVDTTTLVVDSMNHNVEMATYLEMVDTTSATTGVIFKGADRFIHNYHNTVGGGAVPTGRNTFVGVGAGNFTMGSMATNTSHGSYNNALGAYSLQNNTTGYSNIAIGVSSLQNNTTGHFNSALGTYSLYTNTTGYSNIAIGVSSLQNNTTGYSNSAIGVSSLLGNTTGYNNSAMGVNSLNALKPTSKAITAFADYSGTVAGTVLATSVGHGLAVGATTLKISGTANYNGSESCTRVNDDTFYFTAVWVATEVGWWGVDSEGKNNTAAGADSGQLLLTGSSNIFLGYRSGYRQTSNDNLLIIDNQARADIATEATNSIIYGVMAAAPADQTLALNAVVSMPQGSTTGDGTNKTDISATGVMTMVGSARVWKSVDLPVQVVKIPAANYPADDDIDNFGFHRYDDTTEESVYETWVVPLDFAGGDASMKGHFALAVENPPTSGGTNVATNVRMGFEYKRITEGAVLSFTAGTTSGYVDEVIAVDETALILHITPDGTCTTTDWVPHDKILFRFFRKAADGADTYVGDAWIKNYHLEYLSDKLGE